MIELLNEIDIKEEEELIIKKNGEEGEDKNKSSKSLNRIVISRKKDFNKRIVPDSDIK